MNLAEFFGKIGLQALVDNPPIHKHPLSGRARSVFGVLTKQSLSAKSLSRELSKEDLEKLTTYDPKRLPEGALEMASFAALVKKEASVALRAGALPEKAMSVITKASTVSVDSKTFDFSKRENRGILEHRILALRGQIEDEKVKLHGLEKELRTLQEFETLFQQRDLLKLEAEKEKAAALAKLEWAQAQIDAIENGEAVVQAATASSVQVVTIKQNPSWAEKLSKLVLTNQPVSNVIPLGLKMGIQTLNTRVYNECSLSPKVSGQKSPTWTYIQNHLVSRILVEFLNFYQETGVDDLVGQFGQTHLSALYYKLVKEKGLDFGTALLDFYDKYAKPQLGQLTEQASSATTFIVWDILLEYGMLRTQQDILIQLPIKNTGLEPAELAAEVNKFIAGVELDKLFKAPPSAIVEVLRSDSPIRDILISKYAVSAFHKLFLMTR